MLTDVSAALSLIGKSTFDIVTIQQGETDALNGRTQAEITADRATLIDQLREETFIRSDTLFLVGESCQDWDETADLATFMASVGDADADGENYTFAVRSYVLPSVDSVSNSIHFSGASLYNMGYNRYCNAAPSAACLAPPLIMGNFAGAQV
ncbi:hypothetical protein [Breoghania sp.]|uniref:hypothetical protein n=1 Tax=Breoghania sp. TaxID=2065378 RepID=UPI0026387CD3|nr:hypothetical protein [Breoghania sp.]MDJ0929556.1 hypothetical protein [Breoghania sp.]